MELHFSVKFKVVDNKAPAYHSNTSKFIMGPVNNFGYSCIHQVCCKLNNAETQLVLGVNLAYREYFWTLLESDPCDKRIKLKRQGWYQDVPGEMNKWGGDGIKRQRALVNDTGKYEFNICPMPCNFTQIDQNVPPNTKVEFDTEFNSAEFALMARKYKADGTGTAAVTAERCPLRWWSKSALCRCFTACPSKTFCSTWKNKWKRPALSIP